MNLLWFQAGDSNFFPLSYYDDDDDYYYFNYYLPCGISGNGHLSKMQNGIFWDKSLLFDSLPLSHSYGNSQTASACSNRKNDRTTGTMNVSKTNALLWQLYFASDFHDSKCRSLYELFFSLKPIRFVSNPLFFCAYVLDNITSNMIECDLKDSWD